MPFKAWSPPDTHFPPGGQAGKAAWRGVIFRREQSLRGTPSNASVRVDGQPHVIDRQTTGGHGRIGEVTGVIMDARPRPILRALCQPRLHRVQVIKNQLSDTTKRRSRDMAPSLFLKPVTASRHFSMSSIPHGVPQSNFSRRKITLRYAADTIPPSSF